MNRSQIFPALFANVCLAALAVGGHAVAQTKTEAAPTVALDEVVVTARKTSEKAQDVPIAITTVTTTQLANLNVRDLLEVQQLSPGLFISSLSSSSRIRASIRGQTEADSRLTTDPSVAVYIDGVNIPRDFGLRGSFVDIAQVEVLKGPQGTLYGKSTTGGALNITTQHPTPDLGGYLDLLYGNYNQEQATAVANVPLVQDRVAVRLMGQAVHHDGFGHDLNGRAVNNLNAITGRANVDVKFSDKVTAFFSADYLKQSDNGPNNPIAYDAMLANGNAANKALGAVAYNLGLNPASAADRLTAYNAWLVYYNLYRDPKNFYNSFSRLPAFDDIATAGISATFNVDLGAVQVKSISAFRRLGDRRATDLDGTPYDILESGSTTSDKNFSQELQLLGKIGDKLSWQGGLYYSIEHGEDEYTSNSSVLVAPTTAGGLTDVGVQNISRAVYGQVNYNITPEIRITGGVRYTRDTRKENSHNRTDPAFAFPTIPGEVGNCSLLVPSLGGPTFPNCSYPVSTSNGALTYLLSADWHPTPDQMLYASLSRGYRAGGWSESSNGKPLTSVAALNAAFTPFRPEFVTNYEFGFKSEWLDHRLRLNASAYYQKYTDVQVQIATTINGVPVNLIQNAARATLYGGEVELTAVPVRNLELNAGVGALHPKYNEYIGLNSAGVPTDLSKTKFAVPYVTYNLQGTYTVPLQSGDLAFNLSWAWKDDTALVPTTPALDSVTQKAYGLLEARISYNIDKYGLNVAIYGKNLTNEHYFTGAGNDQSLGFNIIEPGDPRLYGVQIRKTF